MSEKVKLLIEISKSAYEEMSKHGTDRVNYDIQQMINNGTPLDSNSERAEVQAYFDGQAYGWEQGRKALIDDLKVRIENATTLRMGMVGYVETEKAIDILDNIGKGE